MKDAPLRDTTEELSPDERRRLDVRLDAWARSGGASETAGAGTSFDRWLSNCLKPIVRPGALFRTKDSETGFSPDRVKGRPSLMLSDIFREPQSRFSATKIFHVCPRSTVKEKAHVLPPKPTTYGIVRLKGYRGRYLYTAANIGKGLNKDGVFQVQPNKRYPIQARSLTGNFVGWLHEGAARTILRYFDASLPKPYPPAALGKQS